VGETDPSYDPTATDAQIRERIRTEPKQLLTLMQANRWGQVVQNVAPFERRINTTIKERDLDLKIAVARTSIQGGVHGWRQEAEGL